MGKYHTEDIGKIADFALKTTCLKFQKQISGTAIETKFTPPYACIFMDHNETEF